MKYNFNDEQELNKVLRRIFQRKGYWWYKIPDVGKRSSGVEVKRPFDAIVIGKDKFAAIESKVIDSGKPESGFRKLKEHQIDHLCLVRGFGHLSYVVVGVKSSGQIYLFNMEYVLQELINSCSICPYFCYHNNKVYGVNYGKNKGNIGIMVIGIAPSQDGIKVGQPFQGKSKELFWDTIYKLPMKDNKSIFVSNILKCFINRKTENIDPSCIKWLNRQYFLYKPNKVIILGNQAEKLIRPGMYQAHVNISKIPESKIIYGPHPMRFIYNPNLINEWNEFWKSIIKSDIKNEIFNKESDLPF